ncbi:MAG: hypothetical protein KDC03_03330, partial [Flavobacteriales bacterium]|nr:hypothetical protein [Flavobacteriales bacterium]
MKTVRALLVLFLLGSFLPGSAQEPVEVRPVHVYAVSHTNDQAVVLTAVIEATSTDDNAVILKRIGDNAFNSKE